MDVKKKLKSKLINLAVMIGIVVVFIIVAIVTEDKKEPSKEPFVVTGYVSQSEDGSNYIVGESVGIMLITSDINLPEDASNGDIVSVVIDGGIAESYPCKANIKSLTIKENLEEKDIPEKYIEDMKNFNIIK